MKTRFAAHQPPTFAGNTCPAGGNYAVVSDDIARQYAMVAFLKHGYINLLMDKCENLGVAALHISTRLIT